jgi:Family of unknown function (DUF6084)
MVDLTFAAQGARAAPFAAAPHLVLDVRIASPAPIHAVVLRAQIRIEPQRRAYTPAEEELLADLFGARERWPVTMKSMLWTNASAMVPAFEGSTVAEIAVPCSFDLGVAAAKYFYAVAAGDVPIVLYFSGTVFHGDPLQVAPIPWTKEAFFALPARVWREALDQCYPGGAPLTLRRDVFDRFYRYKQRQGAPTFEHALLGLLPPEDG